MVWPTFGNHRLVRLRLRPFAIAGAFLLLLAGCNTLKELSDSINEEAPKQPAITTNLHLSKLVPLKKLDTEPRALAAQGIKALDENRLADASKTFNRALSLDITNSYLQFLNAYTYHLIGDLDDTSKYPLALEGYKLAVKFDPTNWVARYYMGVLQLAQKNFPGAQKTFADAVLYKNNDPDLLYKLAFASYYAKDPITSAGALKRLRELKKNDPASLQASAIVMGALNEKEQSHNYLKQYASLTKNPSRVNRLTKRLSDWDRFHRQMGKVQLAQFGDPNAGGGFGGDPNAGGGFGGDPNAAGGAAADTGPKKMVIVDVVILRTEENITSAKGVNLLNGLQLQFGGITGGIIYNNTRSKTTGTSATSITKTFSISNSNSVGYSLNIANANSSRNEILARPTLIALSGQESNFFSGTAITAAAVGGAVGSSGGATINIEKEFGVKLSVTPTFLPDGRVRLKVLAERTFLSTPDTTSVTFTLRIDTTKTSVNANVVMNLGESLILSGLSEKETERRRNGVPGLQDIPILQYFLSNKTTRDFQKSVMVILTPRLPSFVYQSDKQKKEANKTKTADERVLSELQARYSDWFRPYPNWASVFHHMQKNSLYREFRTGDVALEQWPDYQTHGDRFQQVLDFLFY